MARKGDLRIQRQGTVINVTSSRQEKALQKAIQRVSDEIGKRFPGIVQKFEGQWKLRDVVEKLRKSYPDIDFVYYFDTSSMRPDGGILSIVDTEGQ